MQITRIRYGKHTTRKVIAEGRVTSYGGGSIDQGDFHITFDTSQIDGDVREFMSVSFSKEEMKMIMDYQKGPK